ncbi:hypothetical protein PCE1_004792 [Barthelona sp. PCE]
MPVKIACIGAGYVGGPTMAVMAGKADVICTVCDISQKRVDEWNSDVLPIFEPGLKEYVEEFRGSKLFFSTDIETAVVEAEIVFLAVNTPTKKSGIGSGMSCDLTYLESAARSIATICARHNCASKIVVEKSTVPVGTATTLQQIMSCLAPDCTFHILNNPEFLAEGTAIRDLEMPDRVLVGSESTEEGRKALKTLTNVYSQWIPEERILCISTCTSELSKLVANAFLAQRVSSINSISALCERVDGNINEVSLAIGMDNRIGSKFLKSSVGFGGSCFQKDVLNLVYLCRYHGIDEVADYWEQVILMNDFQKRRFAENIVKTLFHTITNKKIALLGFAFKKDTSDTRESAAICVAQHLLKEKPNLHIYDPMVPEEHMKWELEQVECDFSKVHIDESAYAACEGAHGVAIITEWDEFKTIDWQRVYDGMVKPAFVFDGRNILDHELLRGIGFKVHGIGTRHE